MDIALRSPSPEDIAWIAARQGAYYIETYGFEPAFCELLREVVATFASEREGATAPNGERTDLLPEGWIALGPDGQRHGSILCTRIDQDTAQLRLFFVEPAARGHGLGRRLLWQCIEHADTAGCARLCLWTHSAQRAACGLYERTGFVREGAEWTQSFGVDAEVRRYVLDLSDPGASHAALLQ